MVEEKRLSECEEEDEEVPEETMSTMAVAAKQGHELEPVKEEEERQEEAEEQAARRSTSPKRKVGLQVFSHPLCSILNQLPLRRLVPYLHT